MSKRFTALITKEEEWYVARCVELGVVSQGKTIEKAQANLKEAVELYLESFGTEDLPESLGEVVLSLTAGGSSHILAWRTPTSWR